MMKSVRALTVGLLLSSVVLVVAFVVPADAAVKKTSSLTVKVSGAPKRYPAMITVTAKNFIRQLTQTATLKNLTPGTYTLKASAIYSPTGKWVSKPPRKVSVKAGASAVVVVSYQKVASVGSLAVTLKASPQGKPVKVTVTGPKGFKNTLTKSSVINGLQPGQYSVTGSDIDLKENLTAIAVASDETPIVLAGERSKVVVNWNSRQATNLVVPTRESLVSQNVIAGVGEFQTRRVEAYQIGDPVLLPATETEQERIVIVKSIKGDTVSVLPGSIYDALPVVEFNYASSLSSELQQNVFNAQVAAQGTREFNFFGKKITADWGCKIGAETVAIPKMTHTPVLELLDADLEWNLKSMDIIRGPEVVRGVVRTGISQNISLEISSKLSLECRASLESYHKAFKIKGIQFYLRGKVGLVSSVEAKIVSVNVEQTDIVSAVWGVDYSRKSGLKSVWVPYKHSNLSIDNLGSWSSGTTVEGTVGVEVDISLSPFTKPFNWSALDERLSTSADLRIGLRGKFGVGTRMTPKENQVVGGSIATFGFQKFRYATVEGYIDANASLKVDLFVDIEEEYCLCLPTLKIIDKSFEPIGPEYFRTYTFNKGSSTKQPLPSGSTTTTTTSTTSPATAACASGGACAIGEIGPGGGKVFYVSLTNFASPGSACGSACKYLEVAPIGWYLSANTGGQTECQYPGSSTVDPRCVWSSNTSDASGATGTAIGAGYANTSVMIALVGIPGKAGTIARAFRGGGKNDWSLPSKDELNEMYRQRQIASFASDWYWSSSETGALFGWVQSFKDGTNWDSDGAQFDYSKQGSLNVRPMRAF